MSDHDIFIETRGYYDELSDLLVMCSCGSILKTVSGYGPQIALDEIVAMAWEHRE